MNEFRAPDEDMVDFMLGMSNDLRAISSDETLTHSQAEAIKQASHSMRVLLAMSIAGHHLFMAESRHADALANLVENLYDRIVMSESNSEPDVDISALVDFRAFRADMSNMTNGPFLGDM